MNVFICLQSVSLAFALLLLPFGGTTVTDAFSKDDSVLSDSVTSAFGWDSGMTANLSQADESDDTHTSFRHAYQVEAYHDSTEALTAQLESQGYTLDMWEGSGSMFEGGGAKGIVAAALAEVGSARSFENPRGSNSVFYNEWFYGRAVRGSSYPWCAVFISWCADQCGFISTGLFPKTSSCSSLFSHLTDADGFTSYSLSSCTCFGGSTYEPVPGDIVFWRSSGSFTHAGIITSADSGSVSVTQGNCGGCVCTLRYSEANFRNGGLGEGLVVHVLYPSFSFSDSGDVQDTVFLFLTGELGMSTAGACGAMGNFQVECGWNLNAVGDSGTSYGLCQWHSERWNSLIRFCSSQGLDSSSLEGQLRYLQYELGTSEGAVLPYMQSAPPSSSGAASAALSWARIFERCDPSSYPARQSFASRFYDVYGR